MPAGKSEVDWNHAGLPGNAPCDKVKRGGGECGAPGRRTIDADATVTAGRPVHIYRCTMHMPKPTR